MTSVETARTDAGPAAAADGSARADTAGRVFRQVTVVPALLAMAWLLAGLPLLLLGHFTPLLMLSTALPLAAVMVALGLRWIPDRPLGLLAARGGAAGGPASWWSLAALIVVAVAFGADQLAFHSQQIIVQRDPASYVQFGTWIARHGSLPIPQDLAAFGGSSRNLTFNTPAFYQVGSSIVPQFMAGLPMTLAAAVWVHGLAGATAAGVLLGSCGVLVLGGLVGRLVGPGWAPLGALALALSLPEQFTSRSTYSEPLAQLLFLGGLCMVVDSFTPDGPARRKIAALGGLAIGLTLLVRIDGISDMLPLIPYCGLLLLRRYRQAWPLIAGTSIGAAYGAADGLILSRPYLSAIKGSLLPVAAAAVALLVLTAITVCWRWRRGLPELPAVWLPSAAAALAVAVTTLLTLRPYFQIVHGAKTAAQQASMARLQAADHLPIQPTRMYYEISMHWVFWYLGIPAVVLATLGVALLARRCLRGEAPAWTLPLMSFAWIIVATLLRPSIVPDQPWASRRLVPAVLPGFIVLAVWAASWITGWLRGRDTRRSVRVAAVIVLSAALLLPAVKTTFGIAHRPGGPLGVRIVAVGLADKVTYRGEVAAVGRLCAAIPPNSSVLFVSDEIGREMSQVVRSVCGQPAAIVVQPATAQVRALIAAIRRAGRRPVLLASSAAALAPYRRAAVRVMRLHTPADSHVLVSPPVSTHQIRFTIWMSEFAG
jgi:hypothetical protein